MPAVRTHVHAQCAERLSCACSRSPNCVLSLTCLSLLALSLSLPLAAISATAPLQSKNAAIQEFYGHSAVALHLYSKARLVLEVLCADAGVADPENLTWEQFAEDAKKLTKGSGADKVYGAYIHTWNSLVQGYAAAQQGKSYDDPDYSWMTDQYNLTLGMQKDGTIMNWATANSQQVQYKDVFEKQQAAMVPMGTWLIAPLLADKKAGTTSVDWGIAPLPQIKANGKITTDGGPTGFGINKNSKNVAAAKKFLQFAVSPAGAKAVVSVGIVPAYHSPDITKAYFGLEGMPQDATSKKAFNHDVIKLDAPVAPNTAAIGTILNQEHQLIMTGSKSVDDGIAEMESRVKSEVLNQ